MKPLELLYLTQLLLGVKPHLSVSLLATTQTVLWKTGCHRWRGQCCEMPGLKKN